MMLDKISSFGEGVLGLVAPVFSLFKEEGFAPFLAFAMFAFTFLLAVSIYFSSIRPGKKSLDTVLSRIKKVSSQTDFAGRFNEIDAVFSKTTSLKHGWEKFCETLIKPDQQTQIFRNTIRPNFYLNMHEVEYALHLKILHFTSNLLVGIGLLLTFVGLVAALTFATCGISNHETGALAQICTHSGSGNQLDAAIKDLLHAASLKFWTSVSGLGCSILLRIFYESQHTSIKNRLQKINAGIERGLQFVTPEYLALESLREAQEQSAAMKRFSTDLALSLADKIQTGFTAALSPVHESLKDMSDRITGGIGDAIKGAAGSEMQQLAQNMGGIVESLNASRAEMDGIGRDFRKAMAEAAEALKTASGEASNEMSQKMQDVMSAFTEGSSRQAQMFEDSMKKLSVLMDQAGKTAGDTVKQSAVDLAAGMNGVSDGVRDAASSMAERMTHLSSVLQAIEERMSTHVQTMDVLTGRARDTEQAMGVTSRLLSDAAKPVTEVSGNMAKTASDLNTSIQNAQKVISESHKNLANLATNMAETQQVLQSAWQAYDKRFTHVDESLAKAVAGIVDNVRANIDSMGKFVTEVDKKLGASVQIFGQSISEFEESISELSELKESIFRFSEAAEDFKDLSSGLQAVLKRISTK